MYEPAMSFLHAAALLFLLPRHWRTANCRNCRSKEETRVNSSVTASVCTPVRSSALVGYLSGCMPQWTRTCLSRRMTGRIHSSESGRGSNQWIQSFQSERNCVERAFQKLALTFLCRSSQGEDVVRGEHSVLGQRALLGHKVLLWSADSVITIITHHGEELTNSTDGRYSVGFWFLINYFCLCRKIQQADFPTPGNDATSYPSKWQITKVTMLTLQQHLVNIGDNSCQY